MRNYSQKVNNVIISASHTFSGLKNVNSLQLEANEHVSVDTKRKYRDVIDYLPANYRQGYLMYTTKPDDDLVKRFEKFVIDPYLAPLMAESLAGTHLIYFQYIVGIGPSPHVDKTCKSNLHIMLRYTSVYHHVFVIV